MKGVNGGSKTEASLGEIGRAGAYFAYALKTIKNTYAYENVALKHCQQ